MSASHPMPPTSVLTRPGLRTRDAIIAAAAAMALADGRAELAEQRGLLVYLRRTDMLALMGRQATVDRFTAELARRRDDDDASALTSALGALAGTQAAHLIAGAAASVAAADGMVHPKETEFFIALTVSLGLTASPTTGPDLPASRALAESAA